MLSDMGVFVIGVVVETAVLGTVVPITVGFCWQPASKTSARQT